MGSQWSKGTEVYDWRNYEGYAESCRTLMNFDLNESFQQGKKGAEIYDYYEGFVEPGKALMRFAGDLNNNGVAYYISGKYEEAIANYNQALMNHMKFPEAWNNKGNALYRLGKYEEAIAAYDKALVIDPKFAAAWNNKGNALDSLGKYEGAIAACEEALRINQNYAIAWNNKGFALKNLGKCEEAIAVYDQALRIDPQKANVWSNKGVALQHLKNFDSALQCYVKALEINPQHESATFNRAALLSIMEQHKTMGNEKDVVNSNKKGALLEDSYLRNNFKENELQLIGEGSSGKVYSAVKKEGGTKIALKVIETTSQDSINDATNELMALITLKGHPNIITYEDFRLNQVVLQNKSLTHQLFLEMPLADLSLEKLLQFEIKYPEQVALDFLYQICLGLQFAHEKNIAHLDLKPDNILIFGGNIKIADWGGSLRLKSSNSTTAKQDISYTRGYEAPELFEEIYGEKEKYNYYSCDIYSLAMIVFRLCGIPLRVIKSIPKTVKKFHDQFLKEDVFLKLENTYSYAFLGLLEKMSAFYPEQRISIKEIITFTHEKQRIY